MTSPLNWQDFLKQAGLPDQAVCLHTRNPRHALVRVTGKDAESFLHAQFSNSVTDLQPAEVRFAAWCNAKGRVWTLVRYWKDGDGIILRMPADQVEATVKRMSMFVLRSDVQLESMNWHAAQFLGPDAEAQAWQCAEASDAPTYCILLPGAWALYEVWSPKSLNSDLPELPESLLALPRILAGQPEVFAGQREEWIPQMLNLDKLDGIDFKKGCYPGQEIVAKLHYKGGLKQRMHVASVEKDAAQVKAGDEILDADGGKVGHVVEATHGWMTVVLRSEAINNELRLTDGSTLRIST